MSENGKVLRRVSAENANAFFSRINSAWTPPTIRPAIICVVHVLPGTAEYLAGLQEFADVVLVLAKPSSIDDVEFRLICQQFSVEILSRSTFVDESTVATIIRDVVEPSQPFVILDIGGYFSSSANGIGEQWPDTFRGIVEDTQNGHERYLGVGDLQVPVISVAQSEIKSSEDYLVGQWIVFSIDAIMREIGSILSGRLATVIGFGKIGKSVAAHLSMRGLSVTVVEKDPVRAIEAKARGFRVLLIGDALRRANVIVSATGRRAISREHFRLVQTGSYLASVTSADDEMEIEEYLENREVYQMSEHIERVEMDSGFFYLLNRGNAVNFAHRGGLGPFIYPVQGEMAWAAHELLEGNAPPGIQELSYDDRQTIAQIWMECFSSVNSESE